MYFHISNNNFDHKKTTLSINLSHSTQNIVPIKLRIKQAKGEKVKASRNVQKTC